ncbi:Putrescine importer PuuP [Slackia heliotrinireducens]|uniref:Amino acid transporter n=1 Tax=Slackia heliotrinireducens (strain ATCC 29202 / DSM 20476 / NCTC 11029 / RHS 1) TaxID=471855 RepID=C7N1R5_SLAHD|nr:APC family permease [Slackia heliotrinireducens]ACV23356.1 amino acid transporter [Slackia heliotrinireducens DSM 20476]VEH02601.1 Putrescine importer PuuP [Slackia heliotrinireducens]
MAEKSSEVRQLESFGYKQELRRGLTLPDVVLYGVLFMVIIAPHSIYGYVMADGGGMPTLVYLVGFCAIFFTALSYMAMSNKFPIAGSVYSYVQRGINPHIGFLSGWLILLDYCIAPALLYTMVGNWGVALVDALFGFQAAWVPWVWIVAFIAFNTFVNIRGIGMTKGIDYVFFAVEILIVIAFVVLAIGYISGGGGTGEFNLDPIWQPGKVTPSFIAAACSIACLNFLGFDGISTLAEETEHPEKNIGRGILIALFIIVICFMLQTYFAALAMPLDTPGFNVDTAFFQTGAAVGGQAFYIILLVVNILAIGVANIMNAQLAASRLLYGMGRDKVIPSFFGKVHPKYQTPWLASFFIGGIALVLTFLGVEKLTTLVNFGALTSFMVLNFAVFWYFWVREGKRGAYAVLRYIICPFCGIAILFFIFTGFETFTMTVGFIWLAIGIIVGAVKSKGYKEVPEAFKNLEF